MISYLIKRDILLNDTELLKAVSKATYKQYIDNELIINGVVHKDLWHDLDDVKTLDELRVINGYDRVQYALQIKHANIKRKTRLKERINDIIKDALNRGLKAYFVTFTFSPDLMNRTSEDTRKQYVRRTMSNNCIHYVGNIDFGADERYTEREHYHAVVSCRNIAKLINDYVELTNSKIFIETIKLYSNYTKTNYKLAKYISKLSNHALKESATEKRICYIYDRNKEYML